MCRFVLYVGTPIRLSSLVTEPSNSLIHQSFHSHEREEPLNGDGFGLAWYAPRMSERPAVFRSVTPAWNNQNLLELVRVVESPCVLAHVRAATAGLPVNEANCHPFTWGRYAFMHNGDLGGFPRFRRRLLSDLSDEGFDGVRGSTDSEHLFAMFLDHLREGGGADGRGADESRDPSAILADALTATIRDALALAHEHGAEPSYLNMAVADGECAVATRCTTDALHAAESLYVNRGRRYVCEGGVCRMLSPEEGGGAVIVSSERLSDDETWEIVPPNHMVVIGPRRSVRVKPIDMPEGVGLATAGAEAPASPRVRRRRA
jgi:predicted glutamine amidotransferase